MTINKKRSRIIIIIVAVCVVLGGVFYWTVYPRRGTTSNPAQSLPLNEVLAQREAAQDLDFLFAHLKSRHPAWMDGSENLVQAVEDQYHAELAVLDGEVTVLELWQASARIATQLGDGHTWVRWEDDGTPLFINSYKQLSDYGLPLIIDEVATGDVLNTFLSRFPAEIRSYGEALFMKSVIVSESLLTFCGIDTSDGVDMTFQTDDGEQSYHYVFVPLQKVEKYNNTVDEGNWVDYEIDPELNLGVFTLRSCVNDQEYRAKLDEFFSEVIALSIDNIVVDLRGNGGGNSSVANEFLKYIDVDAYKTWDSDIRYGWFMLRNRDKIANNPKKDETFSGNLYVLTDTFTYSAAMDFAMLVGDNHLGTLVGEPSGNMPSSYGDILVFQMPNSGLVIRVSYKKWYRIDASKAQEPLMADIMVSADEAFGAVLDLIAK